MRLRAAGGASGMRLDLYSVAHSVREGCPIIWNAIEKCNEWLFLIRYGRKLEKLDTEKSDNRYFYRLLQIDDTHELVRFLSVQPAESFHFFKPHKFNEKTIKKLLGNKSYLAFGVFDDTTLIGYYFLKSFFIGKSYFGKIVDYRYQGKGIAKQMSVYAANAATTIGIHMYGTISKDNKASLLSAQKALDIKIIKELPNNYMLVEELPKGSSI